ncbi:MAG: WYL domain-containing protein [Propionicimonas sp.]|nr:WYL domain-containing protein [Propionicimonas sp.]
MAPRKSERIMNLTICLLMARRFVDKAYIRQAVEGYHGLGDAAFERAFERDKEELRELGVPIETGSNDPLFPDEAGYRIRRSDFELPAIDFTPAEAAVLGLATRVWDDATQADQAVSALAKLRAAGVDPDPSRVSGLAPSVGAREQAFVPLWKATVGSTPVSFGYRGKLRRVQPWTMAYRQGAWYLLGHDLDRQDSRTFKLARIDTEVTPIGRPGEFARPDVDARALLDKLRPSPPDAEAVLAIRADRGPALRRQGVEAETDRPLPPGYHAYRVPYSSQADIVGEICAQGADVLVLEPSGLAAAVIAQLRTVEEAYR